MSNHLSPIELQALRSSLIKQEGYVEHMYLDTRGKVTIGIGHLISSESAAKSLALFKANGSAASPSEIAAEYLKILSLPYGRSYGASSFKPHATLRMMQSDIYALLDAHITSFEKELRMIYPSFNSYPTEARLALFDMIFNLGMTKLRGDWPNFNAAIMAKDWKEAAKHSNRPQLGNQRNQYVKNLLNSAK